VIPGTGPEVLVAVEDIEDLDLHIGQLAGHDRWFALNCYIGEAFMKKTIASSCEKNRVFLSHTALTTLDKNETMIFIQVILSSHQIIYHL
jgi:hypothetical protein